jgi:hypothetical protein
VKTVFVTIIIAAVTQAIICCLPGLEYSGAIDGVLTIGWFIGSLFLGFNAPNSRMVFWCSVGLSVPAISYSMSLPPFPFYGDVTASFVGGAGILYFSHAAKSSSQ